MIETKIFQMVTHPDLDLYVTWASLENALKGIRDALDSAMHKEPVEQRFTQTTPVPPQTATTTSKDTNSVPTQTQVTQVQIPVVAQPTPVTMTRPTSSSPQPSKELQEILLKLGTLNQRHEDLKDLVELLRVIFLFSDKFF